MHRSQCERLRDLVPSGVSAWSSRRRPVARTVEVPEAIPVGVLVSPYLPSGHGLPKQLGWEVQNDCRMVRQSDRGFAGNSDSAREIRHDKVECVRAPRRDPNVLLQGVDVAKIFGKFSSLCGLRAAEPTLVVYIEVACQDNLRPMVASLIYGGIQVLKHLSVVS